MQPAKTIVVLRRFHLAIWLVLTVGAIGALGIYLGSPGDELVTPTEAPQTLISGQFLLVDHNGQAVTEKDYNGRWRLMFFGFTHCPDICPTTLNTMAKIMSQLGNDAKNVVPLFVSVDPERDRPAILKEYAQSFDDRIIGLTGSVEQIKAAAGNFRVYYKKTGANERSEDYLMDHSSIVYLMDTDGRFATVFSHRTGIDKIVTEIRKRLYPQERGDWLRVIELAEEGPLTEAARRNLEAMDVKTR